MTGWRASRHRPWDRRRHPDKAHSVAGRQAGADVGFARGGRASLGAARARGQVQLEGARQFQARRPAGRQRGGGQPHALGQQGGGDGFPAEAAVLARIREWNLAARAKSTPCTRRLQAWMASASSMTRRRTLAAQGGVKAFVALVPLHLGQLKSHQVELKARLFRGLARGPLFPQQNLAAALEELPPAPGVPAHPFLHVVQGGQWVSSTWAKSPSVPRACSTKPGASRAVLRVNPSVGTPRARSWPFQTLMPRPPVRCAHALTPTRSWRAACC